MLSQSAAVAVELPEAAYERRCETRYTDIVEQATLTFRGQEIPVSVVDLSSRGTSVESAIAPRMGESVIVQFENCSRMHGFIRWARDGRLGIRFGHEIILAS